LKIIILEKTLKKFHTSHETLDDLLFCVYIFYT